MKTGDPTPRIADLSEAEAGSRRAISRWSVAALLLIAMAAAVAAGAAWFRERAHRHDLDEAREALARGRLGLARERLIRLTERHPDDTRAWLMLGECEVRRGRRPDGSLDPQAREAALGCWARVPASSPDYALAALAQAPHLIKLGRYGAAERVIDTALATPSEDLDVRYELERSLSRVYRFEGRTDDVRRVLRASWCRSFGRAPAPASVLKELWILDHSPIPVEALRAELDQADDRDEGTWLGRANLEILTGHPDRAAGPLDRLVRRHPDDPAVWQGRLSMSRAAGDVPGVLDAAAHLAADPGTVDAVRTWLAARSGDPALERRELEALIRDDPADTVALERLAVLRFEAGETAEAEMIRRRKVAFDQAIDPARKLLLEVDPTPSASELAGLCRTLHRDFDARAWALVAEAGSVRRGETVPPAILARARDLSAPYEHPAPPTSATLAERLADLRVLVADRSKPAASDRDRPAFRFVDDAHSAGLDFRFDNGQTDRHLLPETMSGGVALLDYDGDGWLDVYCVQGGPLLDRGPTPPIDRLFRNRGDGTFDDVSGRSGIAAIGRRLAYGLGVAVGDFDNDGDPDLFLTRLDAYAMLRNRGDGTFDDVTSAVGLAGHRDNPSSAAMADLDGDGDLDLYVCHYMIWDASNPPTCLNDKGEYFYCDPSKVEPAPDRAFRNDGGRFVDVTESAGLTESSGRGLGVVAADLDDDGRLDLYVANDGTANYLYRNLGGFRFEEIALEAGVAGGASGGYQAGMGVACDDLDGDGRLDLLVTNFYGEGTSYYQNLGRGLFADRSAASGLGPATRYLLGFGVAAADVANSGRLDILITNGHVNDNRPFFPYPMPSRLYAARPEGRWVDVSDESGECWEVVRLGRGLAVGDVDNDGRTDALILPQNSPLAYFHNRTEPMGRFVTLRLEGDPASRSNRDAVGARITAVAGGRTRILQRQGGGSYQSSNDPRLHIGLGDADRIEQLEVRWPSGRVDRFRDLPAGSGYLLREGVDKSKPLPGFPRAFARKTSAG